MNVTNKGKADRVRKRVKQETMGSLELEIAQAFQEDLDTLHRMNLQSNYELDIDFLEDEIDQLKNKDNLHGTWENSLMTFSPSAASKCERELAFKEFGVPRDEVVFEPYQKRWVRNGSAVHRAFQRDLIYLEKQDFSRFEVVRTDTGRYAWERNVRTVKKFKHNGVEFQIYGMTDGFLHYKPRDLIVGVDLKTKSTTIAAVGDYKLKVPLDSNIQQMVAYSLLFGVDHFVIPYESLAKDSWNKGKEARPDMKVFCITVTDEQRKTLLDKFARVADHYYHGYVPKPDFSKCLFCPFKSFCDQYEKELNG